MLKIEEKKIYFLIAKTTSFLEVPLANIEDIAAMKIAAIAGRGIKRDFIDLYFVIHEEKTASLEEVLTFYDKKFKVLQKNGKNTKRKKKTEK